MCVCKGESGWNKMPFLSAWHTLSGTGSYIKSQQQTTEIPALWSQQSANPASNNLLNRPITTTHWQLTNQLSCRLGREKKTSSFEPAWHIITKTPSLFHHEINHIHDSALWSHGGVPHMALWRGSNEISGFIKPCKSVNRSALCQPGFAGLLHKCTLICQIFNSLD